MLLPLLLLFTGVVRGQLPFHPKFLASAGGLEDSPFLEAQRDALNLHEGDDESVSLAAPIAIDCTARGTDFTDAVLKKGAASLPDATDKAIALSESSLQRAWQFAGYALIGPRVSMLSRQVRLR